MTSPTNFHTETEARTEGEKDDEGRAREQRKVDKETTENDTENIYGLVETLNRKTLYLVYDDDD